MDQDPVTPPPAAEPPPGAQSSGGKPAIFQHVNTTVAGVTGLLVALGGLVATWDKIFPSKPATEQAAAAPAPQAAANTQAATAPADEPEAGAPLIYKGELVDGGKTLSIEWDGESWIVTEGGNDPWAYDDTLPPDDSKVMAVSNGHYLRWPIGGGEVDESEDKVKWKTYARVDAVD